MGLKNYSVSRYMLFCPTPEQTEPLPLEESSPMRPQNAVVHQVINEVFWQDVTSFPVEYVSTPIREKGEIVGAVIALRTSPSVDKRMKDEFISVVSHELRTPLTDPWCSGMLASGGLLNAEPETVNAC